MGEYLDNYSAADEAKSHLQSILDDLRGMGMCDDIIDTVQCAIDECDRLMKEIEPMADKEQRQIEAAEEREYWRNVMM